MEVSGDSAPVFVIRGHGLVSISQLRIKGKSRSSLEAGMGDGLGGCKTHDSLR